MEVGVIIPNAGPKASPENIRRTAQFAETLGFHSVWVTDHVALCDQVDSWYPYRSHGRWDYASDTNWIDPLLSLQWAAAAAPSLKIGTSILVVPLRNPLLLAKQIASIDFLTGGRFILGAGAGWMREEFQLIGQSFENRGKRLIEMIALMRQCWSGDLVDFHGDFYHVSGFRMYPTPLRRDIPVVWGGHSDAAIRRCARTGDGWHPTQITIDQLREGLGKLRDYCRDFGRDASTIPIVARPGNTYRVTEETHAQHVELGVTHLVADTPIQQEDPTLDILRGEMERIAKVCGLTSRSSRLSV